MGSDFVPQLQLDGTVKFLLLEVNLAPHVDPEDIGLDPRSNTSFDAELTILRDVAQRFGKNN